MKKPVTSGFTGGLFARLITTVYLSLWSAVTLMAGPGLAEVVYSGRPAHPPVIGPVNDLNVCSFDQACGGVDIDFEVIADSDCSAPALLGWKYFIDVDNDNSIDYTSGEYTGQVVKFTRNLSIGTHRVIYTVWDECGNTVSADQMVTVRSCASPKAKCVPELSTSLMPMDIDGDGTLDWGIATLNAKAFDMGSIQPCGNPLAFSYSPDINDQSHVFDCSAIGKNEVELWVIDQSGLSDFCLTSIDVQDHKGICPPVEAGTGIISGNISVPESGGLGGAVVYLDGSNLAGIPSGSSGHFIFPAMPVGEEYSVRPEKAGDDGNGVSTIDLLRIQKHLLGLEPFSTPFQYIAADANDSKSISAIDIIQLRHLILGYYEELPNNKSWRFIDRSFVFPDPHNPWLSAWPETYSLIPFSGTENDIEFNAIKIGDLNHSARSGAGNGMISLPRSDRRCEINYSVVPQPEKNIFKVEINLEQANAYEALQLSVNWDHKGFRLLDWEQGNLLSREDFRMPGEAGENLSLSTFSTSGWPGDRITLVTLWVEQVSSFGRPFTLFLNPTPTPAIAFSLADDEGIPVTLTSTKAHGTLIQNIPNPFTDMTTVIMDSDREEYATFSVFDLRGKQLFAREVALSIGRNEYAIRKSELQGAGLYIYKIESPYQYSTNRMIIVD